MLFGCWFIRVLGLFVCWVALGIGMFSCWDLRRVFGLLGLFGCWVLSFGGDECLN